MRDLVCFNIKKGYYQISEDGMIWSNFYNKYLAYKKDSDGYHDILLVCEDGKRRHFRVHRLVAMTYIGNPENLPVVMHLDNNKSNNHYSNLKWGTVQENTQQAYLDGCCSCNKLVYLYDRESKEFIALFIDDYELKKALFRKKITAANRAEIYAKFNFVIETYGKADDEDILSDLSMCLLVLAKRYKNVGKNFCAYVYNAFNKEKYEIIPIYITKQGRWFSGDALLEVKNYRDMAALQNKKPANCESCEFYDYDEEYDAYVCLVSLDEDDMCDFLSHNTGHCPYYRFYDEYKSVRKQN